MAATAVVAPTVVVAGIAKQEEHFSHNNYCFSVVDNQSS
jgi:hypothetical protein